MSPLTAQARAKGSAVHATLAFIGERFGARTRGDVLAALTADDRAAVQAIAPTAEIPYDLLVRLWQTVDVSVPPGPESANWADAAGEASIGSFGVQLYGGILRKPSPREFLTQSISLFQLFYQPGDMEVVEDTSGRAVLRLVGFDPMTRLFCDRLTGGLRRAIALARGEQPRVRHVRCAIEGDAFCEWELQWGDDAPPAGARASS
ncbi:MAG: hypothetical protein K2R93_11800 [Gemmatimonadaceae bacterium]|nr:hypothetical protein [Gemmatimonadaceae bacterium]